MTATPRISVITTSLSLGNAKKREWRDLMQFIGETHGIARAWWFATRYREDGLAHLITYSLQAEPTVEKAATVLANNSDYTYAQIFPNITLMNFAGDTPQDMLDAAIAWLNHDDQNQGTGADWIFDTVPDWTIEPEPEFVEPEEPPGGWPISQPLEWVEVPED